MLHRRLPAAALFCLVSTVPALAQETRAELLAAERAAKATKLAPYEPTRIERWLIYFDRNNPIDKLSPYNGFFVRYGYEGKPTGSGIALGGGWRHDLFGRNGRLVLEGGHSLRKYRMVRGDLSFPRLMDERLEVGVSASYNYWPQEDFYGLGLESLKSDRTSFLLEAPDVQGRAMIRPVAWFTAGGAVGWTDVSIGSGKDKRFPVTEQLFTNITAPGLADDPTFVYTDLVAAVDTRDQPGNARSGGYYAVLWRRYSDSNLDRYSFNRMDLDLQHFVPIFDKKRVIAARMQLFTTSAADDQEVPFYFRPTLGGGDTLRSAADYRFRDRNVIATNIEYRWEAFSGMDMALFADMGSVAPRFGDLEFADETGYGVGLRFNTFKSVFLRLDVATGGRDGVRTFFKFSGNF
jgi:outer membrane protein assembly factor BamA